MGITLFVPLVRSFEPRIAYYKSFSSLFKSIGLTMLLFIPWDVAFTSIGIWGFTPEYLSGIYLFDLPLGEWLFFILVPFSCVFIYRVLNYFWPDSGAWDARAKQLGQYLIWLSLGVAILSWGKWYTVSAFGVLALLFLYFVQVAKVEWLGRFFRAYAVILIPFLLINGVLTGAGLESEVVWYNEDHYTGYRLYTIPLDDVFYGMALILMNIGLYEYFEGRRLNQ